MRWQPQIRRLQFSLRALFVAVLMMCLYLGAVPRIQAMREQWRRDQCHNDLPYSNIYGFHRVTCTPCRRQMITRIVDETQTVEARVAWIQEVAKIADSDRQARKSLTVASHSAAPLVRAAAQAALMPRQAKP